ncbi:MAG: glycosyl transferase family 1, partial [Sphingomonadaceae bacterium]|nr:glycosyl transferase family 1 [Sphingomonadaceae bacterium]
GWALARYERALAPALAIESIHARAFMMLGGAALLGGLPGHLPTRAMIEKFCGELAALIGSDFRPDWTWFETVLAYDNSRLPEALIRGGRAIGRDDLVTVGLESLAWIVDRQTADRGVFRPVGHESFGRPFAEPLPFDQQPVEAWATIDACAAAFAETGDRAWRDRALTAWRWFFGENDLGVALADAASGDCFDGLTPGGVNRNQGAESVLAFQLSAVAIQALGVRSEAAKQRLHLAVA